MTTGIITPSYADVLNPVAASGWTTEYPPSNLTDLVRPSRIARADTAGARSLTFNLAPARSIRAAALVGHNLEPGDTLRIRVYDGASGTGSVLADTGVIAAWPSGAVPIEGLRSIRPVILGAAVNARSLALDITAAGVIELEGFEVGAFWAWTGVSYGRELGVGDAQQDIELVGGGAVPGGDNPARRVNAQVDLMAMRITSTTGLDFQRLNDIQRPFIWGEDFDDAVNWPRKVMLVRNQQLPGMVGRLYRHDVFPVRLIEHLR